MRNIGKLDTKISVRTQYGEDMIGQLPVEFGRDAFGAYLNSSNDMSTGWNTTDPIEMFADVQHKLNQFVEIDGIMTNIDVLECVVRHVDAMEVAPYMRVVIVGKGTYDIVDIIESSKRRDFRILRCKKIKGQST